MTRHRKDASVPANGLAGGSRLPVNERARVLVLLGLALHGGWALGASIQDRIQSAVDGDTIIVQPGVYREDIDFSGKSIVLQSADPTSAAIVASTIIEGSGSGPAVSFHGTETTGTALLGLTIRNGRASRGGGICGGLPPYDSFPLHGCLARIEYNIITSNTASWDGGGIYNCDGPIRLNVIMDNRASGGGGLSHCDGLIEGNWIENNVALAGGGIRKSSGTLILQNRIVGNVAESWEGGGLSHCPNTSIQGNLIARNVAKREGGGLAYCDGSVQNNVIVENRAGYGGGVFRCGPLVNNTIVANEGSVSGGGIGSARSAVVNCVIAGNRAPDGPQYMDLQVAPAFCFTDGDPMLTADWHLSPNSPCIDTGCSVPLGLDFESDLRPLGGSWDIGADEYVPPIAAVKRWNSYR